MGQPRNGLRAKIKYRLQGTVELQLCQDLRILGNLRCVLFRQ